MNRTNIFTTFAGIAFAAILVAALVPMVGSAFATDTKNKAIAENNSTNIALNNAESSSVAVSSSESNNVNQISNTNVNQNGQTQNNNQTVDLLDLLGLPF